MKRTFSLGNAIVSVPALLVTVMMILTGCSKREPAAESAPPAAVPAPATGPASAAARGPRSRAVTVETTLTVDDVDARARTLREALDRAGGYVADANVTGSGEERGAHFDLRVPADALPAFVATLRGAGTTASYTERTEDVTDELTDVGARLTNARTQEKRILELMATKASTLGEVIEAEKELSRIRETIERLDAQSHTVAARVTYATVRVTLRPVAVESYRTPGASIAKAAATGMRGAATFFTFLAMAVVVIAPTLLPFAVVAAAVVMVLRARLRRKDAAIATQD